MHNVVSSFSGLGLPVISVVAIAAKPVKNNYKCNVILPAPLKVISNEKFDGMER